MNHRSFITVRECTKCGRPLVLCEHKADPRQSLRRLNNKSKESYKLDDRIPDYLLKYQTSLRQKR